VKKDYVAPAIRELGSLEDLTQTKKNKIGSANDIFSQVLQGITPVGSLVPVQ
jgi:hypothetical protein